MKGKLRGDVGDGNFVAWVNRTECRKDDRKRRRVPCPCRVRATAIGQGK